METASRSWGALDRKGQVGKGVDKIPVVVHLEDNEQVVVLNG